MSRRAIFIDKDNTLVENIPFNVNPARVKLLPGVEDGLRQLSETDYLLFVVTNQPGLALGKFTEQEFAELTRSLEMVFSRYNCVLKGVYACPHHPEGIVRRYVLHCGCHKPQPGLLLQAAQDHDIDLKESWMIGDILNDVEAGKRAGCHTVLVDNGGETEWNWTDVRQPDFAVNQFDHAIELILKAEQIRGKKVELVG
jgi:D-glycero-D-manno-heptose 1,7-bisphosphate phosphatase